MPGVRYALGGSRQRTIWYGTWPVAWLLFLSTAGSKAGLTENRPVRARGEDRDGVDWDGEDRDGMFSCQNFQSGEEALNKPSLVLTVLAEQTRSAALCINTHTEGLDRCWKDNHDKGFGQEVLGCMCAMKRCHHKSSSDNSLGVTTSVGLNKSSLW